MNDKIEVLTLNVWLRQVWNDHRLTWNSSDYAGIKQLHVDSKKIWVPDLKVYNEVSSQKNSGLDLLHTKAIVYFNGSIKWLSPSVKKLSCNVDMKFFPYDTQRCYLKIGSWTYDGFALDLKREHLEMDVSKSLSNHEWKLIGTNVERNVRKYVCCVAPYPDITYILTIKRRESSYWFNFVFPGMFLTVLTMMSYVTAATDTGERISLVLTSLVSMFFFLKLVSDRTPASDTIPLLSIYFVVLIFEIGLILYSVCVSLNAYHKHPAMGDMPNYLRNFVLNALGNVWGFDGERKRIMRRFGLLNNTSKMKIRVVKELECMKNGLSYSDEESKEDLISVESRKCSHSLENNGDCSSQKGGWERKGMDKVRSCTCRSWIEHMIKRNNRLLHAVRELVFYTCERNKNSSEEETWLIAVTILDRVFLVVFTLSFIVLSLINFLW
ncbi:acetylcholine receptor subunit alpha-type acr-16-like isoform X3 [Xenia sp. Carnegie-2017]|nr:acetylcholine receptor subunit alpha-type acr-16-like isoform X3 [Xenia sp. Carnegie-2017]